MRNIFVVTFAIAFVLWPSVAVGAGLCVACFFLR